MTTVAHALPQAIGSASIQPNLTLVVILAGLIAVGTALILDRSLVRVLLGLLLIGNGVAALYLVVGGRAGAAPFVGAALPEDMSDPLPQAMVLTAIVISLATIGFLLAMSYRLWQLTGTDDVPDDSEDARILRLAREDGASSTFDPGIESTTTADELAVADEPDEQDEQDIDPDPSERPEGRDAT